MTTLLIAEHEHENLKDSTNKALTAATQLGAEVHVLVAGGGEGTKAAAEAASRLAGVAKVLVAEGDAYAHDLAEPFAALIVALAPSYDAFVAPATSRFKNVMPRVAALLDVMQVSEIIKVISPDTFARPIYAGNAIQTVKSKDAKKVITVRTSTFQAAGTGGSAGIETAASAADPGSPVTAILASLAAPNAPPCSPSASRCSGIPSAAAMMPIHSPRRSASSRPLRVWKRACVPAGKWPSSHSTCALATVAWPHRSTSTDGVSQRKR